MSVKERRDSNERTSRVHVCVLFIREESFETKKLKLSLSLTCIHTNVRVYIHVVKSIDANSRAIIVRISIM